MKVVAETGQAVGASGRDRRWHSCMQRGRYGRYGRTGVGVGSGGQGGEATGAGASPPPQGLRGERAVCNDRHD